jgi:hypothetical protein
METSDYWQGFEEALNLVGLEVDKILAMRYNDSRCKDQLLDVKVQFKCIREMATGEALGVV